MANNIQLGLRVYKGPGKGRLVWQRPRRSTLYELLHHPFYAGAYAYGRSPLDPTRRVPGRPKAGRRTAPPEEWVCLLRDKVPAYISWDQFEQNRRRSAANDLGGRIEQGGHRSCPDAAERDRPVRPVWQADGGAERAGVGPPPVRV